MSDLRAKSVRLTGFLERLLLRKSESSTKKPYWIITPSNLEERGAQLSVQLEMGMLHGVLEGLTEDGVVVDERKPDVIRVAPAPLYNSFVDVWNFVEIFDTVCERVKSSIQ